MTRKVFTVSIPQELYQKMEKYKGSFNFSRICQNAIYEEIRQKEEFERDEARKRKRFKEMVIKTPLDIMNNIDISNEDDVFGAGVDIGFYFASSKAPYHVLKGIEQDIDGWDKMENEAYNKIFDTIYDYYENIKSELGIVELDEDETSPICNDCLDDEDKFFLTYSLSPAFHIGFLEGIVLFIHGVYEPPEVLLIKKKYGERIKSAKSESERSALVCEMTEEIEKFYKVLEDKEAESEEISNNTEAGKSVDPAVHKPE